MATLNSPRATTGRPTNQAQGHDDLQRKRVIGFTELKERYIPQRYPLVLIDRVTDYSPGEYIEGIKCVTGNSPELVGHFPERAFMPGTTVLQAFGQLAIVFFKLTQGPLASNEITLVSSLAARFFTPIPPGEQLFFRLTPRRLTPTTAILNGIAQMRGRDVVRGAVTISKVGLERFADVPW